MAAGAFADIRAITDLEEGIRTFGRQMANANSEIEHTIDLYFKNFEHGLQILEERLYRAKEELEQAERALEHQRNRRVWVEDDDGDGHWEQADCSAEEAAVARCQANFDRWRRDVETCRLMISDARTKRHIHKELFSQLENGISETIDKIGPVKELVEKHLSTSVPSSSFPPQGSFGSSSSPSPSSDAVSRGTDMPRPRPPMNTNPSSEPRPTSLSERPRSLQNEHISPTPDRPVTEEDRPRSPSGEGGRVTRGSVSSFREGIEKILNKHKTDDTNE